MGKEYTFSVLFRNYLIWSLSIAENYLTGQDEAKLPLPSRDERNQKLRDADTLYIGTIFIMCNHFVQPHLTKTPCQHRKSFFNKHAIK